MSQLVKTYKGTPMVEIESGLITGTVPAIHDEVKSPSIKWNGRKIPGKLLLRTVSFSRHVLEKYGSEVQWRLAYNKEKGKWAVIVLNQYIGTGMYSEDCVEDGEIERELAALGSGWVMDGTGHSHCNSSAFQSGTDHNDELKQTGFHYTVGHINKDEFELHCRRTFRGVLYEIEDQFEMFNISSLSTKNLPRFPAKWRTKLKKKPVVEYNARHYGFNWTPFQWPSITCVHKGNPHCHQAVDLFLSTGADKRTGMYEDYATGFEFTDNKQHKMDRPMYENIRLVVESISEMAFEDALNELLYHVSIEEHALKDDFNSNFDFYGDFEEY